MAEDNYMGCEGCRSLYESSTNGKLYCLITTVREKSCPCKVCLVKLMCGKRCDDLDEFENNTLIEIQKVKLL